MPELGALIRNARTLRGISIHHCAEEAKISGAYLQKIETGHVHAPSPHILYRLATPLEVSYSDLMAAAGYIVPEGTATVQNSLNGERLTREEAAALTEVLAAIRARTPAEDNE